MAAITLIDFFNNTGYLLNILSQGEQFNADESASILIFFNQMVQELSTDRTNLFTTPEQTFSWTGGAATRTIGPTGQFDTTRPVLIQTATVKIASGAISQALELLDVVRWQAIQEQGLTGVLPLKLYCDYAEPLAKLYLWPVPSGTLPFVITTWEALAAEYVIGGSLDNLPLMYQKMLMYNLAVNIAPAFSVQTPPEVASIATSSKQNVRNFNAQFLVPAIGDASTGMMPSVGTNPPAPAAAQ